jgi:hypothetical protein
MNTTEIIMLKCIVVFIVQQIGLLISDELKWQYRPIIAYITGIVVSALIFSEKIEALLVNITSI